MPRRRPGLSVWCSRWRPIMQPTASASTRCCREAPSRRQEGNPAALEFIANLHPMKRMASAEEIAQAALFLLSDRSSFMTGSPMIADGGPSVPLT